MALSILPRRLMPHPTLAMSPSMVLHIPSVWQDSLSQPMHSAISSPIATDHVSALQHSDKMGALIDCGANGGIVGADCCVIKEMHHFINVKGIDNHVMEKHPIVTAGGITNSNKGPIILIMNQYALSGKVTSIHSSPQMEWYNVDVDVDDRSIRVGGKLMSLLFLSISDADYHIWTCVLTQIRNGMSYHTSISPEKRTGTHPFLIMSNLMTKNGMTSNPLCCSSSHCLMSMGSCTIILKHMPLTSILLVVTLLPYRI